MTKTFKILSTISFIAMAIVLTFVGVWALTDLDFTVGGDITYTAPEPEPVTPEEVSYLTFEYYDDLTAKLISCSSSAPQVVEIPAQIIKDGKTYTVTKIAEGEWDEDFYEATGIFSYVPSGIVKLIIPDSITEIGVQAFAESTFGTVSRGKSAEQNFDTEGYGISPFTFTCITNLVIRNGVIKIGDGFFSEAQISNISFPNTLKKIGVAAFSCFDVGADSPERIDIPDSVEIIECWAFAINGDLKVINIGSGIKEIDGDNTFSHCDSLIEIYIKAPTPPTLKNAGTMFNYVNIPTIYVPTASADAYKSADGWIEYADYIVGYDF
ncbi:MAG: leucine-rich repeat domain-containing protein [Clostridia bacterium]|nr:leucine-rich repeat domain-containing protein [Clostridia bacterium]